MTSVPDTAALYERARQILPGGVNSPVRAFKAVGGVPKFIDSAQGAWLTDRDGGRYLDMIGSWGPMILGHNHPSVVGAVRRQAGIGMSFGAPSELEVEMAELLVAHVSSLEMVRMVNSGTEACMSAIRAARGFTGRDLIIKFEGCYHGHGDAFLSKAGSGAATFGVPTSPGVPKGAAAGTLNATFNSLDSVRALLDGNKDQVAAIIVEPVVGNMGCVPPEAGFLEGLRALCTEHGAVLIFDEVMTGFRLAFGGAQERFGVVPDMCTLGKIIGGGLPVGAYGGRREIMSMIAPAGPVYQAGTLSGNPLAMAAGLATLRHLLEHPQVYAGLESKGQALQDAVSGHISARGYAACMQRVGSMATVFFHAGPIRSWEDAKDCDTARFAKFFWSLMEGGVHMPPAQYEAFFLSDAHSDEEIAMVAGAMKRALDAAFA